MDMFMDKLAQKLTAQDIIKANTAADVEELNRLKNQIAEYNECLVKLQKLIDDGAARLSGMRAEESGTARALEESLTLTAPGGVLVLMGNPDGPRTLSQDLYWRILRKQLTLTGTWNSSFGSSNSDWIETVQALADASLQTDAIVSHLLSQKELSKGLQFMRSRSELFCKIMIKFDREVR